MGNKSLFKVDLSEALKPNHSKGALTKDLQAFMNPLSTEEKYWSASNKNEHPNGCFKEDTHLRYAQPKLDYYAFKVYIIKYIDNSSIFL